jgi:hypothetical protein
MSSSPVKLNTNTILSTSVLVVQKSLASAFGALLWVGLTFLCFTSLVAALVSGCPFRSGISSFIRLIFEIIRTLLKRIPFRSHQQWPWVEIVIFILYPPTTVVFFFFSSSSIRVTWLPGLFILAAIPLAYSMEQEVDHKPQKYKISLLVPWMFLLLSLTMISIYFNFPTIFILFGTGASGFCFACCMLGKMSKSMTDTGEIDAIAWLLITTPPENPATLFKKAGQMTGFDSIGSYYRPRLLKPLMPLLALLITSYHAPEHLSSNIHSPSPEFRRNLVNDDVVPIEEDPNSINLEIYVACLARLSDFTDYKGTFWCLWEDSMQHPKLEEALIDKLVVLANPRHQFQVGLRSAAAKVLNNYGLDIKGNPLRSPANVLWRSAATLMLNVNGLNSQEEGGHYRPVELATRVEPAHSSEGTEEV